MKKTAIVTLILCLAVALPATATGGLVVSEESFYAVATYDDKYEACLFAVVTNTGDQAVVLGEGRFVVLSPEGTELYRNEYLSLAPAQLEPGESGVIQENSWKGLSDTPEGMDSYTLTVTASEELYFSVRRFPATGSLSVADDGFWRVVQVLAEIENDTAEPVYNLQVAYMIRDAEGRLLGTASNVAFDAGVPSGGRILLRKEIRSDVFEHMLLTGSEPVNVEVIAYTEQYD